MTTVGSSLRLAGAVGMVVAALAAPAASADSSPQGRLTVLSQSASSARLLLTPSGLPAGAALDVKKMTVLVDGVRANATLRSVAPTARAQGVRRAVLVFDTSGSMAGAGIAGAREAALAFLTAVPADVEVGLVAFSDRPRLLIPPTMSRTPLRAAVGGLAAAGETSLYDGISLALKVVGNSGARALVVLSDGADTRSRKSLTEVTALLRSSGVRMDAVALNTGDAVRKILAQLAAASRGEVTAAGSAAQLAAAFSSAAQRFAAQYMLEVTLPSSARGHQVTVEVSVPTTTATTLRLTTQLDVTEAAAAGAGRASAPVHHRRLPLLPFVLVAAGLAGVIYALLTSLDARGSSETRTRKLLERYTFTERGPDLEPDKRAGRRAMSGVAQRALELAERVADKPGRREKIVLRLGRADVSLKPNEWLLLQFLVAFGGLVLGTLLFGALGWGIVSAVATYLGTRGWLSIRARRRLRAFDEHLPNSLQLVAGSLSAGFSLAQALDGVVREGLEPISGELNRALAESRLGVPLEDALDGVAERMDSVDFRWVVMAVRIQREVGGNLAEVLLNTAMMMRERARLRRQVKALSAEGRLSAYVLFAIPLLMTLYLFSFRRAYIRTLYTDPIGIGFLVSAVVLLVIGALWMRKIVTVEV